MTRVINTAAIPEQDRRVAIMDSFLSTPHGDLSKLWPVHQQIVTEDPLFYAHLAAWYWANGDIRDHKELFVTALCLSQFEGHRDEGLALLRDLPPYQVINVFDFIHGTKKDKKVYTKADKTTYRNAVSEACKKAALPKFKKGQKRTKEERKAYEAVRQTVPKPAHQVEVVTFGLERTIPRSLSTEITRYLREREADPDLFDGMFLSVREKLKRLYATLHIKPSERAVKILYGREMPDESRLAGCKALAKSTDPNEQARLIVEHHIPFKLASTLVSDLTPPVLLALVSVMSPQELINSMGMLKRRGALDNPTILEAVEAKLGKAKKDKRVSGLKAQVAAQAAGITGEVEEQLQAVADAQVKSKGAITAPTALLIDKSKSMVAAIEVGKRLAAMLSAICTGSLFVYAFDTVPYKLKATGTDLDSWDKAMKGIHADGGTSCGVSLRAMQNAGERVEKIILVSDGGDNTSPTFPVAYQAYCQATGLKPQVVLVKLQGDVDKLVPSCKAAQIDLDIFNPSGADYYSFTGLIPMLSKATRTDLLLEIMTTPIPVRRAHESAVV